MGYFGGPNKALINPCFKRPKLVSCLRKSKPWREREEERRRGEEEEEGEKFKQSSIKVWNYLDF